ncbi:hypothetical protein F3Y22_tig00110716pilonHSYRG00078 [Hibiscus syriacus]|uniref:DUF4283 domain-containing protein n=1 Tax=Hibiscus syriacus TaxID=106335 RepID=A0A6A2ZV06_HIBSY|nr:hypothetical protein F3Y22_tig00110716pilonHSYRG00078 [Hibiscus syriacus]
MDPTTQTTLPNLSLEEEEDDVITVESPNKNLGYAHNSASVWRPLGGIAITDVGEGRYLFRLFHEVDMDRIEAGGPWNFNSHMLIIYRLKAGEDPAKVPLDNVDMWVQVHDVPPGIMRIKVRLDIRKPLKCRKRLATLRGSNVRGLDVEMTNVGEEDPVTYVDGAKRLRIQNSSSEVSNADSTDVSISLSAALLIRPAVHNEISKLECPGLGEVSDCTSSPSTRMSRLRQQCGFVNGIDVGSNGRSGGLSIGWENNAQISLWTFADRHIDIFIDDDSDARGSERQMAGFRSMLTDCDFEDLGYSGQWFTWEHGRLETNNIMDRGVANTNWWELFPNFRLGHLPPSVSDHCPILLSTDVEAVRTMRCGISDLRPLGF